MFFRVLSNIEHLLQMLFFLFVCWNYYFLFGIGFCCSVVSAPNSEFRSVMYSAAHHAGYRYTAYNESTARTDYNLILIDRSAKYTVVTHSLLDPATTPLLTSLQIVFKPSLIRPKQWLPPHWLRCAFYGTCSKSRF